jgi:hypothetical protein
MSSLHTPSLQTLLVLALTLAFLTTSTPAAQPPQSQTKPHTLRYLFLVEISSEMATRQIPSAQTIHDIVLSSFQGEIKESELFTLWFYGSRLQTNSPVIWRAGREAAMARHSANLFSGRIFSKLPQGDTLTHAAPFIAASPKLTIFLFTDGSHPITGTPFDAALNSAIEQHYSLFLRADRPFVVTFIAKKGKLVDASVHTALNQPFRIPELDRKDETLDKALQAVRAAPQPKPAAAADLDKALAAVRNAAPPAPSGSDKARAALRDAMEGKTNAAPEKLAMQFSPALKEPPKEQPATEETKPQPPAEKLQAPPPLLTRPTETTPQIVPPSGGPTPSNPQPQNNTAPPENPVPPKTIEVEKPAAPKPIVRDDPKPVIPQPPIKTIAETPKPIAVEQPKTVATTQPTQPAPPQAKPSTPTPTPTPPAPGANAPAIVETKSQSNTHIANKPSPPPPTPPVQTAVVTPTSSFPWPALIGGLAVITFGGAIAVFRVKRRAKSPGSIITQALPRNGPRLK